MLHKININKGHFSAVDTEIFSCAIDPKDKNVALACGDGTVRIYNMDNDNTTQKVPLKIKAFSLEGSSID